MEGDRTDDVAWNGPTYLSMSLFCGEHDGWVEVIDTYNTQVLRLSLAAAEDLAAMLAFNAKCGRKAASTPEARGGEG